MKFELEIVKMDVADVITTSGNPVPNPCPAEGDGF